MRTINELLIEVRKELLTQEVKNCKGLCIIINITLWGNFSSEETELLKNYMTKSTMNKRRKEGYGYWWKIGIRAPRMRWLNKHIKLTQDKKN